MFVIVVFSFFRIATGTSPFDTLLSFILGINANRINIQSAKSIRYLQPEMVRLDGFAWDIIEAKKGTYDYRTSDEVMHMIKMRCSPHSHELHELL